MAEACGAPADLPHRGIMDGGASISPGAHSVSILGLIRIIVINSNSVFRSTSSLQGYSGH